MWDVSIPVQLCSAPSYPRPQCSCSTSVYRAQPVHKDMRCFSSVSWCKPLSWTSTCRICGSAQHGLCGRPCRRHCWHSSRTQSPRWATWTLPTAAQHVALSFTFVEISSFFLNKSISYLIAHVSYQGCISCGILLSGTWARGASSEHMENMEMFSCSPT